MSQIVRQEMSVGWYGVWKNIMFPVQKCLFWGRMKGSFSYASIDLIAEEKILIDLLCGRPQLIRHWKSKVVMLMKSEDFVLCV